MPASEVLGCHDFGEQASALLRRELVRQYHVRGWFRLDSKPCLGCVPLEDVSDPIVSRVGALRR